LIGGCGPAERLRFRLSHIDLRISPLSAQYAWLGAAPSDTDQCRDRTANAGGEGAGRSVVGGVELGLRERGRRRVVHAHLSSLSPFLLPPPPSSSSPAWHCRSFTAPDFPKGWGQNTGETLPWGGAGCCVSRNPEHSPHMKRSPFIVPHASCKRSKHRQKL